MHAVDPVVPSVRRAPYGDNPVLGPNGSWARVDILAAARAVFRERGYHDATIEEIGLRSGGRTGASVYQYFAGKNQIFLVFMHELGTDLVRHSLRLGRLGASRGGYEELRVWLAGLSSILRRHLMMFSMWPSVLDEEHSLLAPAASFVDDFTRILHPSLSAVVAPEQTRALAIALLAVPDESHVLRASGAWRLDEMELDETLARVFQLALFPGTADMFIGAPGLPVRRPRPPAPRGRRPRPGGADGTPSVAAAADGAADLAGSGEHALPGLRKPVGRRAAATVARIADVAAGLFARQGIAGTSISDIAAAAGVGHSSVYTYWSDRNDLVFTLAWQARNAYLPILQEAADIEPGPGCEARVRAWVEHYLAVYPRHAAILRLWRGESADDRINALRAEVTGKAESIFHDLFERSPVAHLLGATAIRVVFYAILTLPYYSLIFDNWMDEAELSRVLTRLLAQGMLGATEPSGATVPGISPALPDTI